MRNHLWSILEDLDFFDLPWCNLGDFNCILDPHCPFPANVSTRCFRDFIKHCGLIDLGFFGSKYTWCNNRHGSSRILVRLDCVFGNVNWMQFFGHSLVFYLPRQFSDHGPLKMKLLLIQLLWNLFVFKTSGPIILKLLT